MAEALRQYEALTTDVKEASVTIFNATAKWVEAVRGHVDELPPKAFNTWSKFCEAALKRDVANGVTQKVAYEILTQDLGFQDEEILANAADMQDDGISIPRHLFKTEKIVEGSKKIDKMKVGAIAGISLAIVIEASRLLGGAAYLVELNNPNTPTKNMESLYLASAPAEADSKLVFSQEFIDALVTQQKQLNNWVADMQGREPTIQEISFLEQMRGELEPLERCQGLAESLVEGDTMVTMADVRRACGGVIKKIVPNQNIHMVSAR